MLFVRSFIAALAVFPAAISARSGPVRHVEFAKRQAALPENDPFYKAPSNLGKLANGDIIRSRKITIPGASLASTAYQILFRTSSNDSTPFAAATTLIIPRDYNNDNLISYSLAQDGNAAKCAPSYTLPNGMAEEVAFLNGFLNRKWAITATDFYGPAGAFAVGRLSGKVTLDAIRASVAFKTSGFAGFKGNGKTRVGFIGYSVGAGPAAWAAQLAPAYAPELNLVGAAFGGVFASPALEVVAVDGSPIAGYVFATVTGVSRAYSTFAATLRTILTSSGRDAVALAASQCTADNLNSFANKTFRSSNYLLFGPASYAVPTITLPLVDQNLAGRLVEVPKIPILVTHLEHDAIAPIQPVQTAVNSWCSFGIESLVFLKNNATTESHVSQYLLSAADFVNFIGARLNGDAPAKGCNTQTVRYQLAASNDTVDENGNVAKRSKLSDSDYFESFKRDRAFSRSLHIALHGSAVPIEHRQ